MTTRDLDIYGKLVDGWVAEKTAREIEWSALVDALPGVYPEIVRDSALRLGMWSNVRVNRPVTGSSSVRPKAYDLWLQGRLKTPHILDGCWWFADDALTLLSRLALKHSASGDAIGLFGAPTLYYHLQTHLAGRELLLVDRGISWDLAPGRAVRADMLGLRPKLPRLASVSVVDPPWYVSEIQAFLQAARRNSTIGGTIFLSVPPLGTRPGVSAEWEQLLLWCEGIGLRLTERMPLALRYLSPPFELNALRAAAVPSCRVDWRRGDLAIFECVQSPSASGDAFLTANHDLWQELEVGRVHLKLKIDQTAPETSPLLEEIVPGDVLPTVSRRDGRGHSAVLWTSGNRVFGSCAATVLWRIMKAIAIDERAADPRVDISDASLAGWPKKEIGLTAETLRRIIEIEEVELEDWSRSLDASLVELAS